MRCKLLLMRALERATSRLRFTGFALVFAIVALTGCRHSPRTPEEEFALLFEGFRLIWIADAANTEIIEDGPMSHPEGLPPVPTLTVGKAYGLLNERRFTSGWLGIEEMPDRLRKMGAHVVKAPKTSNDLTYAFLGGPFFMIEFEKDGHKGTIFNRLAKSGFEGEAGRDLFVLIYQ